MKHRCTKTMALLLALLMLFSMLTACAGPAGEQGAQGIQGEQGIQGVPGEKGETGAAGAKGDTGAKGDKGDAGESGLSAYQIYLKYHPTYTGTEEEWIDAYVKGTLNPYTVTFDLNGGQLVSGELTQKVAVGGAAVPPVATNGSLALSWDVDFSHVTSDLTVKAVWSKARLDNVQLAELGQKATVTVQVDGWAAGSGFFIDGEGTLMTSFHVIEGATEIAIAIDGSTRTNVTIVSFNPLYDLAVLKVNNYTSEHYLPLAEEVPAVGEPVVAVGSPLGFLEGSCTFGYVSSNKRTYGKMEMLQTDVATSGGNSGGPLLNAYGEVVGVIFGGYTSGQNLNMAVKVSMLENIGEELNWTAERMSRWYDTETARSYTPYIVDDDAYALSLLNTYTYVTGVACDRSYVTSSQYEEGYVKDRLGYQYAYDPDSYDKYVDYLEAQGFVYDKENSYTSDTVENSYFSDERTGLIVRMAVNQTTNALLIQIIG